MLWNTLIKKIAAYCLIAPEDLGVQELQAAATYWKEDLFAFIDNSDVRDAAALRQIIPEAFPRKLRKGRLVASQNIHGAWRVDVQKDND